MPNPSFYVVRYDGRSTSPDDIGLAIEVEAGTVTLEIGQNGIAGKVRLDAGEARELAEQILAELSEQVGA